MILAAEHKRFENEEEAEKVTGRAAFQSLFYAHSLIAVIVITWVKYSGTSISISLKLHFNFKASGNWVNVAN